jgi:biotin operon repressor/very-short-patch-repair endonuclease
MEFDLDVDYIVDEYISGRSMNSIGDELGVSASTIRRRLKSRDVEIRSSAEQRRVEIPNLDELADRYKSGEPLYRLASEIEASRQALRKRLKERGVDIRTESEAREFAWERIKAEGRTQEFVKPAYQARRGQSVDHSEKVSRANAREKAAQNGNIPLGHHEQSLADAISAKGLEVTQQRAVDAYNIDVAIDSTPIAVEVLGRPLNRKARRVFRDRMESLFDAGWGVVYVTTYEWRTDISIPSIAEQLHSLADLSRRNKSSVAGRYWVIGSDGELITGPGTDLDDLAAIITPQDATA